MKAKTSKRPKQTKPVAHLSDLSSKKNPKGGQLRGPNATAAGGCSPFICGGSNNHNETLVTD